MAITVDGGRNLHPGELFDSVRLRGASLFSDDRMLPDSQTGFAPVVRGVAETNARVSVRQRGVLLDEVSVAPGPFVLNDFSRPVTAAT